MSQLQRLLAVVVALAVGAALAVASTSTAQAQSPRAAAAPMTALTINIRACEGCEVTLISYLDNDSSGWASDPHLVLNGSVAFVVPTSRTVGMSAMVRTPWEGQTGYVTMVVFRYQGLATGDRIGFNKARAQKKASGCWAGTTEKNATLRFKVRRVNVPGVHGKVPGNIAWTPVTQPWLRPILPVYGGVLGAQDVILCKAS